MLASCRCRAVLVSLPCRSLVSWLRARPLSSCVCRSVPVLAGLNVGLSVDAVVARLLRLWFCWLLGPGPSWLSAPCLGCRVSFAAACPAADIVVSSVAVGLGRLRGAVVASCQWRSAGRCHRRFVAGARSSLIERSVVLVAVAVACLRRVVVARLLVSLPC